MSDGPTRMIGILCDAGKDVTGQERKSTLIIDPEGRIHDARIGWPTPGDQDLLWGPVLSITPDEWLFQCKLALGCGA